MRVQLIDKRRVEWNGGVRQMCTWDGSRGEEEAAALFKDNTEHVHVPNPSHTKPPTPTAFLSIIPGYHLLPVHQLKVAPDVFFSCHFDWFRWVNADSVTVTDWRWLPAKLLHRGKILWDDTYYGTKPEWWRARAVKGSCIICFAPCHISASCWTVYMYTRREEEKSYQFVVWKPSFFFF